MWRDIINPLRRRYVCPCGFQSPAVEPLASFSARFVDSKFLCREDFDILPPWWNSEASRREKTSFTTFWECLQKGTTWAERIKASWEAPKSAHDQYEDIVRAFLRDVGSIWRTKTWHLTRSDSWFYNWQSKEQSLSIEYNINLLRSLYSFALY